MDLHSFIRADDEIYFFYEYTSRSGYSFSPGNGMINNLKKDIIKYPPGSRPHDYKLRAITDCAYFLGARLNSEWLAQAVVVPIPPSKSKDDPAYDDRMLRVARSIPVRGGLADVRELITQNGSLRKSSECEAGERPSIDELLAAYSIDESLSVPIPTKIIILDDVLTTGRHFKAAKTLLSARFPQARIVGIFVARRVLPEGEPEEAIFEDLF